MWALARVSLYLKCAACLLRALNTLLGCSQAGKASSGDVASTEVSSLNSWLHGHYMSVFSGVAESIT